MESWVQRVRPQKRPPHEAGAVRVLASPFSRAKPVVGSGGTPALERMPGHTVYSHLFTIVNVVDTTPDVNRPTRINNTESETSVNGAI